MDVSKLTNLGWKYKIELEEGLKQVMEMNAVK
jgi:nucleoside-diphosphate-sugar epimerase